MKNRVLLLIILLFTGLAASCFLFDNRETVTITVIHKGTCKSRMVFACATKM